jgi:hypothetical protein
MKKSASALHVLPRARTSDKGDRCDDSDGSFNTSSSLIKDVKELVRLTGNYPDTCVQCKKRGNMDWQFTKHNGDWGFLCSYCGLKLQKQLGHGDIDGYFSVGD